ncbi:uncharacterized protein LOC100828000 [Brachypodium distachyon]|uniref:Methyltransferase type 11 domain-containing protein n=1 Tax=Brachypodium distachyon TaxID=15368 RepID=I1ICN8_BRADI|nr:uncharacterized protein LOC100828000 [Brachypodium distachyon]KQK00799.1 hypothetical protein BRADI_3g51872v3 [Brachypodium distachyon]|eukprot:XP_003572829.1 uncharacterized protein LOC100828000 [Brachypodium distachyon]
MDCDKSKKRRDQQRKSCRAKVLVIFLVVVTATASAFLFSGGSSANVRVWKSGVLSIRDRNIMQYALSASHDELVQLQDRLAKANSLVETLLGKQADASEVATGAEEEQKLLATDELWRRRLTGEVKLAVGPHKLPLGFTHNLGSDELFPTLGQACHRFPEELEKYMNYEPGGECPSDESFGQRLMLKGCEPLPRRRCRPRSPKGYVDPTPLPASLWALPPDTSIVWDAYTCKNYSCLENRGKISGHYDCKDCFDLRAGGREKVRWLSDDGALAYSIDAVLATRPTGTVRIGLDIGGGSGTFAARMRERGVTIVTTSMNFDAPFNNFIASRGLLSMHLSVAHRLPFFDGTLDVVHSMHVLSNWIPDAMLEFTLFDIHRVLRPGGLFWLDHFFCLGTQMNTTYAPMFDRVGFNKVRWNAGRKMDRGIEMDEWYLSALLEKPKT